MITKEVMELIEKEPSKIRNGEFVENLKRYMGNVKFVDVKFTDIPGIWQHFTVPVQELSLSSLQEGLGFDGSSIRGFQEINESDMVLIPDLKTCTPDPFSDSTMSVIGNVKDPITGEFYSKDPRFIAQKAEAYLKETGIADTAYCGPELEFFIFDKVRFDQKENFGYYYIDSAEGAWNTGSEENNLGNKIRHKEGYFPVAPTDSLQNIRNQIVETLMRVGIEVECHHHEVATAGQCEIDMRFSSLSRMADQVMMYKYVIKNTAVMHGKTATFMPKPLFNDNGSGMHTHMSLWKDGKNLFYDKKGDALISDTARYYIGGLLEHAPALCAIIAPTTNSYKRLVPGFEAPVNLVYSERNRSAAVRIPMYSKSEKTKRIEFRTPDPSCNVYLAFSAMLMAGIDGIKRKIDPGKPMNANLYALDKEQLKKVKSVPSSLKEAMDALESDHKFLLEGNIFTKELIETWIDYKKTKEIDPVRLRPHPWEYYLYYDT
ncbi:type I glutamate--ammonia ligase [Candidatus Woesearchaeota archaeon]|nr:type I glutamate--ammonia ligase [Candidatus Woesearchaeota archaeon]